MPETEKRENDADLPVPEAQLYLHAIFRNWAFWREIGGNFHPVSDTGQAFRSGQPTPRQLRSRIRRHGLRSIVNLRGQEPSCKLLQLEEQICRAEGVALHHYRLFSRDVPKIADLEGAHRLLQDIEYPVLFHCKGGADRAGLMSTLYLHWIEGIPVAVAQAQHLRLWPYLHFRTGKTGLLDHYFDSFSNYHRDHPETDLLQWTRDIMDHHAVRRSFRHHWMGSFVVEILLRRE